MNNNNKQSEINGDEYMVIETDEDELVCTANENVDITQVKGQITLDGKPSAQGDVFEEVVKSEVMVWKTNKFVLKIDTDKYSDEVSALTFESKLSYIRGHMKALPKVQKAFQVLKGDIDRHAEKIIIAMEE